MSSDIDEAIARATDAFVSFLKRKYPHHTIKYVARDLNLPVHIVKAWIERPAAPGMKYWGDLFSAYGLEWFFEYNCSLIDDEAMRSLFQLTKLQRDHEIAAANLRFHENLVRIFHRQPIEPGGAWYDPLQMELPFNE